MRRFMVRHLVLGALTLFFFYGAVFSWISFEINQLFPSLPFHMANTIGIKLCIYKQYAILIDFQHCSIVVSSQSVKLHAGNLKVKSYCNFVFIKLVEP